MRSRALLLSLAVVGCNTSKAKDVAPAPTASAVATASATAKAKPPLPPAPTQPLALDLAGKSVPLPNGLAMVTTDGQLTVILASRAQTCDELGSKFGGDDTVMSLELDVPPGPGGKYFAGHRIGIPGQIQAPGVTGSYLNQNHLVAQIDSVDTKPGGRVKGWATWTRAPNGAKGTFEATMCPPLAPSAPPALGTNASGDVAGEIDGEKFVAKKAFAITHHEKDAEQKEIAAEYLSEIDFFARDDATCADATAKDITTPSLALSKIGGASMINDLTGTVQPIVGLYAKTTWKRGKMRVTGGGWIELESLDFSAPLKGTFRVATPKGEAGGAFTAEVCRSPQ